MQDLQPNWLHSKDCQEEDFSTGLCKECREKDEMDYQEYEDMECQENKEMECQESEEICEPSSDTPV